MLTDSVQVSLSFLCASLIPILIHNVPISLSLSLSSLYTPPPTAEYLDSGTVEPFVIFSSVHSSVPKSNTQVSSKIPLDPLPIAEYTI